MAERRSREAASEDMSLSVRERSEGFLSSAFEFPPQFHSERAEGFLAVAAAAAVQFYHERAESVQTPTLGWSALHGSTRFPLVMDATERRAATADPVVRLEFDLEWPPNLVAAYLVTEPEPLLIDAATPADHGERTMAEELASAGYEPGDLAGVVVTHPHSDHVGAVPELREAGVDVYAPQPAIDQLQRDADDLRAGVREVGRSVGLDKERIEQEADRAVDSLTRNRALLDPDHTLGFAFGESFTVAGRTLEPLHTPGHQVHHASLATTIEDERAMFSGDALIDPFRAAALNVGIDYGAYDAIDAFYTAMDRFEGRDVDRVYPGHGPVFDDYRGAIESTRAALDELVADTREAVAEAEPATPLAIAEERVGEVQHPAHLLDTIGALGTLDSRGDVEFETEDGVRYYALA